MSSQIVPLTNAQGQTFTVQLTVDGNPLTLIIGLTFNVMSGWWSMSITNASGASLIGAVPLVTGLYPAANLLAQYTYLQIGSAYLLNTGNSQQDYPSQNNLSQFSLLWSDTVEEA
jgi:hypothetical protein